jgi:hypothetical protein
MLLQFGYDATNIEANVEKYVVWTGRCKEPNGKQKHELP